MKSNFTPSRIRSLPKAFTLVEVTIALGICATVMVALLGLLPTSLDQMREAKNLTTEARISEEIISDAQLLPWDELIELDGEERYYDDQGTRLQDLTGANAFNHIYTAQIEVPEDGVHMPGAEPDALNEFTQRILIYIGETKGKVMDLKSPENEDKVRRYSTVLSNMDEQLEN